VEPVGVPRAQRSAKGKNIRRPILYQDHSHPNLQQACPSEDMETDSLSR
jgi:hypothetical protein